MKESGEMKSGVVFSGKKRKLSATDGLSKIDKSLEAFMAYQQEADRRFLEAEFHFRSSPCVPWHLLLSQKGVLSSEKIPICHANPHPGAPLQAPVSSTTWQQIYLKSLQECWL